MLKIDKTLSMYLRRTSGSRVLRISNKLFETIQRAATPLADDEESALWKLIKGREYLNDHEVE